MGSTHSILLVTTHECLGQAAGSGEPWQRKGLRLLPEAPTPTGSPLLPSPSLRPAHIILFAALPQAL